MKLDILVVSVHPDDAELACSGTMMKAVDQGKKVGMLDLTRGELGTRGTPEIRAEEAAAAAELMKVGVRENLGYKDGLFVHDNEHMLGIVRMIRKYRPDIILCNAYQDRHPDHGRAGKLTSEACFYSGLRKIETEMDGQTQDAWRPKWVYHYVQDRYEKPDLVVDISGYMERKLDVIKAFRSQFYDPNSKEPVTPISGSEFLDFVEGRCRQFGRLINKEFGEGFRCERPVGVDQIGDVI